jgi:hypothetical protein
VLSGIAVVVLVLVAAWVTARVAGGYPKSDLTLRVLTAREAGFLVAASDAAFPPGGPLAISGCEAGVPTHVDRWLALLPHRTRTLVRLLLAFFEHATLLFPAPRSRLLGDGFRRFSRLTPVQRGAVLEAWGRSPWRVRRIVFTSLRTLLTSAYFASPGVLRATGLAPLDFETPVVDADLLYPRIGAHRDTIRWQPEDRERGVPRTPLDAHGPLHPAYAAARAPAGPDFA